MEAEPQLTSGDTIAGYTVEALIGRGGMGEVFRAADLSLARAVALKVLAPAFANDPRSRERILHESQLAASIDHPNVIPIYSAGEADGRVYIAMRLVEGSDLRAVLRREGALDPARAIRLVEQVAAGLDAAHARGLVHRDVKPSNVLIDEVSDREHCYLADFGITTNVRDGGQGDVSERLLGTLAYVAPEQIRGDPVGPRADVYSLGCLLFECLTGEVPFVHSSDVALIFAHLEEPPPRASDRRSDVPAAVDDVIARALAKDPLVRPETCRELAAEARAALGLDRPPRSRVWPALGLIAVVAAIAVAVAVALLPAGGATAAPTGSVARIDAATGAVTGTYRVSKHPSAVASGARVWVADYLDGALWRIDPATGAASRIPAIGYPRGLALLDGRLYVASDGPSLFGGNITRYDALTGGRIDGVQVVPCSIGAGLGVVYTAGCPYIDRLTTGTGRIRVARKTVIPFPSPTSAGNDRVSLFGIAVGEGAVWVIGDALDRRVFRVAPRTTRLVAAYHLPVAPQAIAVGAGGVWVTSALSGCVVEVDPSSGHVVRTIPTGRGTDGVAVGAGSVWVAAADDHRVMRIDPASGRVTTRIVVPGAPHAVTVGGGQVWVTLAPR